MDLSAWFSYQLKASAEGFVWAVQQVPVERRNVRPPAPLGEWIMVRHIFHMVYYERVAVLPHMYHWLGEPLPPFESYDEDKEWDSSVSVEQLLAEFQQVRAEQIALLPRFDDALWHEVRSVIWGPVSMKWIVSKTYQHTMEHTHDVMRMALFWDGIIARQKGKEIQN